MSFHAEHAAIVDHVNEESRGANWSAKVYPRFAEKEFDPWSLLGSLPGEIFRSTVAVEFGTRMLEKGDCNCALLDVFCITSHSSLILIHEKVTVA